MIEPMLARDASGRNVSNCYWERKFDGVRVIAFVDGSNIKLQARSGSDKTDTFPELRIETKKIAILDGEVVAVSEAFSSIQRRVNRVYDIELASKFIPVKYEVFDILQISEKDTTQENLETRKLILEEILVKTENVSPTLYTEEAYSLWETAMENSWEGIIGKRKDGIYEEGKRRWFKLKLGQEDTFLAIGYTKGTGKREEYFGSLVLTKLTGEYVGQVGTGFDDMLLKELTSSMRKAECPLPKEPVEATWVVPFPVRIKFLEYTNDEILRFPALKEVLG